MTWPFITVAFIAFMCGARYMYLISNLMSIAVGIAFCICVGGRYWRVE